MDNGHLTYENCDAPGVVDLELSVLKGIGWPISLNGEGLCCVECLIIKNTFLTDL
jgi:hypothetical protein